MLLDMEALVDLPEIKSEIKAEVEKAVEHAIPILGWIRDAWKWLADLGQLGGLMAFIIVMGSTLKLLFHIARRQVGLWWSGRWETKPRYLRREEYEMRESLRYRRAWEEGEAKEDV